VVRTAILPTAIVLLGLAVCGAAVRAQAQDDSAVAAVYGRAGAMDVRMATQRNSGVAPDDPPPADSAPSEEPSPDAAAPSVAPPESGGAETVPAPTGSPTPPSLGANLREEFPLATQMFDEWGQMWAPIYSSSSWFAPNRWYTVTDVQTLNHERASRSVPFAFNGTQIFNTNALALGLSAGMRETIGFWVCRDVHGWDHSVEATYRGPENWHRAFEVQGSVENQLLPNGGIFSGATFYYKSQFDSGELNLRWTKRFGKDQLVYDPAGCWRQEAEDGSTFSFVLGLRDTELDEKIDAAFFPGSPTQNQFGIQDHVGTRNNLIGINVGGELDYHRDLWYVGARIKGAPCLNFIDLDRSLLVTVNGVQNNATNENLSITSPAFVTEFSMLAGWQLTPRLSVRASYDFMWLTSVALAPNQVDFVAAKRRTIDNSEGQFLNGASLGLMFHW
jgi:hypothetical protein